jgi:hypothetical protein
VLKAPKSQAGERKSQFDRLLEVFAGGKATHEGLDTRSSSASVASGAIDAQMDLVKQVANLEKEGTPLANFCALQKALLVNREYRRFLSASMQAKVKHVSREAVKKEYRLSSDDDVDDFDGDGVEGGAGATEGEEEEEAGEEEDDDEPAAAEDSDGDEEEDDEDDSDGETVRSSELDDVDLDGPAPARKSRAPEPPRAPAPAARRAQPARPAQEVARAAPGPPAAVAGGKRKRGE